MYKITPKGNPAEQKYQWGYELMCAVFNDLVFCGNLAGFVPAGTDSVTIDTYDVETIRRSIIDIWKESKGIDAQPDDILEIEKVYGKLC